MLTAAVWMPQMMANQITKPELAMGCMLLKNTNKINSLFRKDEVSYFFQENRRFTRKGQKQGL